MRPSAGWRGSRCEPASTKHDSSTPKASTARRGTDLLPVPCRTDEGRFGVRPRIQASQPCACVDGPRVPRTAQTTLKEQPLPSVGVPHTGAGKRTDGPCRRTSSPRRRPGQLFKGAAFPTRPDTTTLTRVVTVAAGVFAPGHLGELTQYLPFELVDDVLTATRTMQRQLRILPSRTGVYFVLALALFPRLGYARVWAKLCAGLTGLVGACPLEKAPRDLQRRLGPAPLKALFEPSPATRT